MKKVAFYILIIAISLVLPLGADSARYAWSDTSKKPVLTMYGSWVSAKLFLRKKYAKNAILLNKILFERTKGTHTEWHYVIHCEVYAIEQASGPAPKETILYVDFRSQVYTEKEWVARFKREGVNGLRH